MPDLKDRACCALVLLLAVAGCGYLRVFNINLGYAAATLGVLLCSFSLGGLSGSFAGVMVGLALSLSGHDCRLTIAFAFGGWLAGLASVKKRRWFSASAFLFGNALALYVMPLTVGLLPYGAVLSGCALFLLTRDSACELFRAMSSPSQAAPSGAESAFLQSRLEQWEVSLRAMAGAVPVPTEHQLTLGGAEELSTLLCAGCGEKKLCFGNDAEKTQARFARLWSAACEGDDALQALLPTLRGCGCIRLHALPATVEQVRVAERIRVGMRQKAELQREMNATHLTAMAENVASIRRMSAGETLGDLQASYQIGKAIHDLRFPAELDYARRVGSHLQAAITWDGLSPLGRQPEKLLRCLSKEYGLNLCLGKAVRNRLELEETPLYTAELGVASVSAGQRVLHSETPVCGDAIAVRQLRGGRYLLALSDGMGHGAHANDESHQTLELLMFALEAGYSHRQAIAVVNGIMLSASDEERFATVDLFDLDLWTGDTDSEKLGACASYLVRGNYIKRIDGSSLPLGILENVASTSQHFRMHSGDILIVVSDGVLDVLSEPEAMERVIAESIFIHPQRMADTILRNALLAANGSPKDDMTVAALLMLDRKRSDG